MPRDKKPKKSSTRTAPQKRSLLKGELSGVPVDYVVDEELVAQALKVYPQLTREEAIEMLLAFGA